jgi:gamma-glutamylcyclotransferase (GGCT)/AIG2-like uncharacterized protein YtfP
MKYYLAYGMNTNIGQMALRCPAAKSLGKVTVSNLKLVFKTYCDVVESIGDSIDCVLWAITESCEQSLDALEGYPMFYDKKTVCVKYDNKQIEAMIYFMTPGNDYMYPSPQYLRMVLEGYDSHGVEPDQVHNALNELHILALEQT